jgi:feruloyl esterase
MDWPTGLRSLHRGLSIAAQAAVARLQDTCRAPPTGQPASRPRGACLVDLPEPDFNPGRLRARAYLPQGAVRAGAPLVVLLHGCGQTAEDFAFDTGWTSLADRLGMPLLLPEQLEANNQQRCFHWFQPTNTWRDHGEAASIAAMTTAAVERLGSDASRVFVAGLSAGGAMAATMLAAYPDLYAAGAVFAGLPVGSATSTVQALARMAHAGPSLSRQEWADRARHVTRSFQARKWPRISIWHGSADPVVAAGNASNLAAQWTALHGVPEAPTIRTADRRAWGDKVEQWTINGLGHAWLVGPDHRRPAPFTAAGPVAAVDEIGRFWGIVPPRR